jgi:hypothetical protein
MEENNFERNKKIYELDQQTPADRLDYSGDLEPVISRIGDNYGIGSIKNFSMIEVGFEEFFNS